MAKYVFKCDSCGLSECDFTIGKAPSKIKCKCGDFAMRVITAPFVSVPNPVSEARSGRGKGR